MAHHERILLVKTGWEQPLTYELGSQELPQPQGEEVLLAVEACGVCHRDLIDRSGRFAFIRLPVVPGHEAAGRVIAVGSAVTDFRVGDRVGTMHRDACGRCERCQAGQTSLCESGSFVLGLLENGGYASHLLMPQSGLYALPDDLPPAEAAVLHCTLGTAYRDLATLGRLRPGERVLITGASGGVGAAAVQLARRLGAEVTALVRSKDSEAFVRSLGAAAVLVAPFEPPPRSIDLALDTVGQPTVPMALRALRLGGRLIMVGNLVPEKLPLNLGALITHAITITGGSGATRQDMAQLLSLHAKAPLYIPIARRLPLSHAEEAQRLLANGGVRGRLVLLPTVN